MGVFEENRVIDLLRDFDVHIALDYLGKVRLLKEEAVKTGIEDQFEFVYHEGLSDPVAARLKFRESTFAILSDPLSSILQMRVRYAIQHDWESFYVTQLGILPVYLPFTNMITLLKFWAEDAQQISLDTLRTLISQKDFFLRLEPSTRPIIHSTMNFVLSYGAEIFRTPTDLDEMLSKYFTYCYWVTPERGFSFSSHILHQRNSVRYVARVSKMPCVIERIGAPIVKTILNRKISVREAELTIFKEENGRISTSVVRSFLPTEIMERIESEHDLRESFLNAVMFELLGKDYSIELITDVRDVGSSTYDLTQTMIGWLLSSRYAQNGNVSFVCEFQEVKSELQSVVRQMFTKIPLAKTLSDTIQLDTISNIALKALHPNYLSDGSRVYFLHPLIASFLIMKNRTNMLVGQEGLETRLPLVKFLERVTTMRIDMELYLDPTLESLKENLGESSKRDLLMQFYSLIRKIRACKALRTVFETEL